MSNYIDTRDLSKRKEELEDLRYAVTTAEEELQEAREAVSLNPGDENALEAVEDAETALKDVQADFGADEQAELAELEELESEISDFHHGETLIPVGSFEDYARELADDIGAIDRNAGWPCNCIDWEQAARELAVDYSVVTYQGEDYYVRA